MINFNYELSKKSLKENSNIDKVRKILIEASEAYYNTDSVILTDDQYDELYKEYKKITGDEIIGAKPAEGTKTVSVEHNYENLVGTLDKAKNLNEIIPFLKRFSSVKNKKSYKMKLSLKFDGNSITIEYDENGKPKKALTRGKDGKGKDIINVFKNDSIDMSSFNLSLLDSEFAIKYEAIISYEDYDKLCNDSNKDYSNPRSLVSGSLNGNDGYKLRKYVTLVPLEMRVKDEGFSFEKGYKKIYEEEINEAYPNNWYSKYAEIKSCSTLEECKKEIEIYYNKVNEIRSSLPFMIDGIVVEFLNEDIINKYFYDPKGFIPQYSFAVKLPYLEKLTQVTDIDFCVGNTGRITPRIWFKPVNFNGTEHKKQQISNYKRFVDLNLGIGSNIMVSYHNDCLSYITKVQDQPKGIKPFKFVDKCPKCGGNINIIVNDEGEETLAVCNNSNCIGRIKGKIENYFINMDIKGIKMNTIDSLYDNNIITDIPSIYNMDYKKVGELLGKKVAQNIKESIESKECFDYEILGSLSITNFSLESAKLLCKKYNLDEIIDLYNEGKLKQKILEIDGFGDISANYILNGIKENEKTIEFLYSNGYKNYKDTLSNNNLNLNIVVTGWRPDPTLELKMESLGIKIKSSVSKKVNILVHSNNPGATKLNKAKELGIKTMSIEEFIKAYKLK